MHQLVSVWNALTPQRRIIVAGATALVFAGVLLLARVAATPGMSLLYSGLEPGAAGEVIAALEQRAIAHEVRGGAIYVDSQSRDALRMSLASEGLPASGGGGYEILDGLSGFGTTSQMFDAAYWRAKEGELARTIVAAPQIRAARVHIANPLAQPFRRDKAPTASVTVTTTAGTLPPKQAEALRFLIASAVSGLSPDNVSVIDSDAGLITGNSGAAPHDAAADGRAALIKANVERLLEARVGRGNAVVEVSIDTVTEHETLTERRFDPEGRVAISTETIETSAAETGTHAGNVTVASNLPDGDAAGGQDSSSQNSETRERTNFEVSETQRELVRAAGGVRRLSVAVLVDGIRTTGAAGQESWAPRSEEELSALRELVQSAVGFDAERGDIVTIKTLAFSAPAAAGTLAEAGTLDALSLDTMTLVQLGVLASVVLALGLFVVRPILTSAPPAALPVLAPPMPDAELQPAEPSPVAADEPAGSAPPLLEEDPVARLRQLIEHRQEDTAEILRNWIEAPEENA